MRETATILIVDDEDDLREAIAFDFSRKGYRALTASGGHEALQTIENEKVDLVITDVHMPKGDGVELLDRIKERFVSLPVFVFIGCSSALDLSPEAAYEKGAEAVFSKPFDRKELFEAVMLALLPKDERLQRASARVHMELPSGINFLTSNFFVQTPTLNIGRGGMFLVLQKQFPIIGEPVEFQIETSPVQPLKIKGSGVVRWIRREHSEDQPSGCGIEFVDLDPQSRIEIFELIGKFKTKSFIPRK